MTKYTLQPPQTPWHRDTLFKQSVIHMTRLQAARSYQRGKTTIRSTVMEFVSEYACSHGSHAPVSCSYGTQTASRGLNSDI